MTDEQHRQLDEALAEIKLLREHILLRKRVEILTEALREARNAHPGYLDEHWNAHYQRIDEVLGE